MPTLTPRQPVNVRVPYKDGSIWVTGTLMARSDPGASAAPQWRCWFGNHEGYTTTILESNIRAFDRGGQPLAEDMVPWLADMSPKVAQSDQIHSPTP